MCIETCSIAKTSLASETDVSIVKINLNSNDRRLYFRVQIREYI